MSTETVYKWGANPTIALKEIADGLGRVTNHLITVTTGEQYKRGIYVENPDEALDRFISLLKEWYPSIPDYVYLTLFDMED